MTYTASNSVTTIERTYAFQWHEPAPDPEPTWHEWVADRLEQVCEMTGHARGCWVLNSSPLRRAWWWALEISK